VSPAHVTLTGEISPIGSYGDLDWTLCRYDVEDDRGE